MSKTQMITFVENKDAVRILELMQEWNKENVSQTIAAIISDWMKQNKKESRGSKKNE